MAAVSILGPSGYPKEPYGSFAGKPASAGKGLVSVLGPQGVPRPPYASFAGKVASVRIVSVLGPQGVPRPPYGSFGGKSPSSGVTVHFQPFINGYMGRMMTR